MSGLYNMSKADFDTTLDLTKIKPYGDTMNDGKMQLSFTSVSYTHLTLPTILRV